MVLARKLRIMMLAPTPFFTDCGKHVRIYEEARALVRRGHQVRIVSYHAGRNMAGVQIDRIAAPAWLGRVSSEAAWCRPYLDALVMKQALLTARVFRPHLIHAHQHQGARIGAGLKKRLGIPLLFDYQGSLSEELVDQGTVRAGSLVHRFLCRQEKLINAGPADGIVTSSTQLAHNLVTEWGVAERLVCPLLDGVNTTLFRPYDRDEVRVKLRLPPAVPLVVYLGALNSNEGIDLLLSAIVQLQSKESKCRFLLMGGGEEFYRDRARALGIEQMIIFTGTIDYSKAPFYLSAGDCAVSPKLSPSGGNSKLLTYMACGVPAVAFDLPGNRELLGDAGVYADSGDSNDLAARLSWLLANSDERARLRTLGLTRIEQRHDWDFRGAALDEIYRVKLKR